MSASVFFWWTVVAGSQYEICYKQANQPQACVRDNSGKVGFNLDEDTLYSFSMRTNGVESPAWEFRTEKVKTPPPAPCPSLPPLPPVVLPDMTLTYHPNGQPYKEHWMACKQNLEQHQGLVARLRKVCGKKCSAVR